MSTNKKYFYLKLKDNFYDRPEIKAIESMESGYEYIAIMQKMYLRSLEREGKLMLTDTIPYDIKILSKVLGHKQETVEKAISTFIALKLCSLMDDKSIYMTEIQKYIGHSSTEADRIREYRQKLDSHVQIPYKCTPELDIELELEKDLKQNEDSVENFQFSPEAVPAQDSKATCDDQKDYDMSEAEEEGMSPRETDLPAAPSICPTSHQNSTQGNARGRKGKTTGNKPKLCPIGYNRLNLTNQERNVFECYRKSLFRALGKDYTGYFPDNIKPHATALASCLESIGESEYADYKRLFQLIEPELYNMQGWPKIEKVCEKLKHYAQF